MKATLLSVVFGSVALAAGIVCHRVAPGLGLVIMPMFWPLAVLATRVPAKYSVTTAAIVPLVSCLVTGMPALPFLVAAKFALFTAGAAWLWNRLQLLRK